jgi:glycine cleavage system H protein
VAVVSVPEELYYTAEHEWVAISDAVARVGITDYAQRALGDVVYVTAPAQGTRVTAGDPCGEVESTKSVSDLFAPVSGDVVAVNATLDSAPELVNTDPYGEGWMYDVKLTEAGSADSLLDLEAYRALLA